MNKQFNKIFNESISKGKTAYKNLKPSLKNSRDKSLKKIAYLLPFLTEKDLLRWSRDIIDATNNVTIYDDAVDANYKEALKNGTAHQMGGWKHRLFDGSHTIWESWSKVKNASPDDTFIQELIGWFQVLYKDGTTPAGLPYFTIKDYKSYDESANWLKDNLGISKEWYDDLHVYDSFEILGTILGAVGIFFSFNKKDYKRVNEILGSLSILSILSADILMGVYVIITTSYMYYKKKKKLDMKNFSKGLVKSSIIYMILGIFTIKLLIQIVIIMLVYKYIKKTSIKRNDIYNHIKNFWNEYIMKNIKKDIQKIYLLK